MMKQNWEDFLRFVQGKCQSRAGGEGGGTFEYILPFVYKTLTNTRSIREGKSGMCWMLVQR